MRKVLITGGAGFIGYHLAQYLSGRDGYCIHLADNFSRGRMDPDLKSLLKRRNIKVFKSDLADSHSYKLFDTDYHYIYHLAAVIGVKNVIMHPDHTLRVNTLTILQLLEWIRKTQKCLKKLFFASTSEVYAGTLKFFGIAVPTPENVPLTVEDITSPRSAYALSKMMGEAACFSYGKKYRIPFVIGRYHNVYGPRMGYEHVIPELMERARRSRKSLGVYSPGHKRAFCYISDAIEATVKLAESRKGTGSIVHIGNNSEEITIRSLAKKIIGLVKPGLKIEPLDDQAGSPVRRCPDITKLRRMTFFKPRVLLNEGIGKTWEWYR